MNRELAIKILKELAINCFEYCVNNLKYDEEKATKQSMRLYNHCLIVGNIAEKIAKKCDLESELCFVLGILHDIGKFNFNRFHGIVGYEIAIDNNFPKLAQIAITHTLKNFNKLNELNFPNNDFKEKDVLITKNLMENFVIDDYDRLIRLCDFMSIGEDLHSSTIEDRLLDIATRYKITRQEFDELNLEINELKNYFETKYKIDIYELLEDSFKNNL